MAMVKAAAKLARKAGKSRKAKKAKKALGEYVSENYKDGKRVKKSVKRDGPPPLDSKEAEAWDRRERAIKYIGKQIGGGKTRKGRAAGRRSGVTYGRGFLDPRGR